MKHKRAVLYELMRDHRGAGANGVTGGRLRDLHPEIEEAEGQHQATRELAQPRTIRLPVGYFFLGVAALLVIALGGYLIGHSKGRTNEALGAAPHKTIARDDSTNSAVDAPVSGNRNDARSTQTPPASPTRTPGPIESNPRTIGRNYFVLVQTSRTNALRVAEFCRKNGLEAYVDRVNNADFRVFLMPGYAAEEMASPAVADLERRIEEVKNAWNESVGRNDLGQHIAVKYRG